jgi:hypothetical protein
MGTFGHNDARDNWFWSDAALDNQAWDNALSVAATGRIVQLTAYMAGDTGPMVGGPALWNASGSLLLYTPINIARRTSPYSGGFDGTGRNPNDGYYINAYGFSHTFTNPTSFIVGAFRRSTDSWILGNSDRVGNLGHLKTVAGSSPASATGGNTWFHEAGFNGLVEAYATYTPLGMFARVAGVWKPVTLKRFYDSVTTYFATVMADSPIHYWRIDEAGAPVIDYGSRGLDLLNVPYGGPTYSASALIVDTDKAGDFNSGGLYGNTQLFSEPGPLQLTLEAWVKTSDVGPDHPGGGGHINDILHWVHFDHADRYKTSLAVTDTDVHILIGSFDFSGICLNDAAAYTVAGVVSTGTVHHIVLTYDAGPNFAGDNVTIYGGPCDAGDLPTAGVARVYIDGVLVDTRNISSFRPQINEYPSAPLSGEELKVEVGDFYSDEFGTHTGAHAIIDEVAVYDTALSATKIAHHYAVGTGSTGGIVSTSATLEVRNPANTGWIALNFALHEGWLDDKREHKGRVRFPDGQTEDVLFRWMEGEERHFGAIAKDTFERVRSGLFVPRGAYRLRTTTA